MLAVVPIVLAVCGGRTLPLRKRPSLSRHTAAPYLIYLIVLPAMAFLRRWWSYRDSTASSELLGLKQIRVSTRHHAQPELARLIDQIGHFGTRLCPADRLPDRPG